MSAFPTPSLGISDAVGNSASRAGVHCLVVDQYGSPG
jgi:hypothetical protein